MSNHKKLVIGLFGFGVVGEGIYSDQWNSVCTYALAAIRFRPAQHRRSPLSYDLAPGPGGTYCVLCTHYYYPAIIVYQDLRSFERGKAQYDPSGSKE